MVFDISFILILDDEFLVMDDELLFSKLVIGVLGF